MPENGPSLLPPPSVESTESAESNELDPALVVEQERVALLWQLHNMHTGKLLETAATLTHLPELVTDPEILHVVEERFVQTLENGNWDDCTKLADTFFTNEATLFFHSAEVYAAAQVGILRALENKDIMAARGIRSAFLKRDKQFLRSDAVVSVATKSLHDLFDLLANRGLHASVLAAVPDQIRGVEQDFLNFDPEKLRDQTVKIFLKHATQDDEHLAPILDQLVIDDPTIVDEPRVLSELTNRFRTRLRSIQETTVTGLYVTLANHPEITVSTETAAAASEGALQLLSRGIIDAYQERRAVYVDPIVSIDEAAVQDAAIKGMGFTLFRFRDWEHTLRIANETTGANQTVLKQGVTIAAVGQLLMNKGAGDMTRILEVVPPYFHPDTNRVIEQAIQEEIVGDFRNDVLEVLLRDRYRADMMKPLGELVRKPLGKLIGDGSLARACMVQRTYAKESDTGDVWRAGLVNLLKDEQQIEGILRHLQDIPSLVFEAPELKPLAQYMERVGLVSLPMFQEYQAAVARGPEATAALEAEVAGLGAVMFSSEATSPAVTGHRFYRPVVEATYPNHAGNYTNYDLNESCSDRTADLASFRFQPKYELDLIEGIPMVLKAGIEQNPKALARIESSITAVLTAFEAVAWQPAAMQVWVTERVDAELTTLEVTAQVDTLEEKIYLLVLEAVAGKLSAAALKEIMVGYQFSTHEDVRAYIQGTRDRAGQSKNPEYSYLLELNEFFADRLKETQRGLATQALASPAIQALTATYQKEAATARSSTQKQRDLSRLRPETLGLEGDLLTRIASELERGANAREVKQGKVPMLFERSNDGEVVLDEAGNPKLAQKGRSIAGMIRAEQQQVARATSVVTGEAADPERIHLGDYRPEELLALLAKEQSGSLSQAEFEHYVTVAFQSIFSSELVRIAQEVSKYELARPLSGRNQTKLETFFTKNKVSAHARAVGGVCTSGDTPKKQGDKPNQWDMPNYFQLVLKDPARRDAQGLVLLHWYQQDGKRYLTASFNPSSTYLYRVDEELLFEKLTGVLEQFAAENQFDAVLVSKNPHIRTNRTGGAFEQAMNQRIGTVKQSVTFVAPVPFSYQPAYEQQEFDVIWQKTGNKTPSVEIAS